MNEPLAPAERNALNKKLAVIDGGHTSRNRATAGRETARRVARAKNCATTLDYLRAYERAAGLAPVEYTFTPSQDLGDDD